MKKKITFILIFSLITLCHAQRLITEKIYTNFKATAYACALDTSCTKGYLITMDLNLYDLKSVSGIFMQTDSLGSPEWVQDQDPQVQSGGFFASYPNFCYDNTVFFTSRWWYFGATNPYLPIISKFSTSGALDFSNTLTNNSNSQFQLANLRAAIKDYDQNILLLGRCSGVSFTGYNNGWGKYSLLKIKPNGEELFTKMYFLNKYPVSFKFYDVIYVADIKKYPPQNYVMYGCDGDTSTYKPALINSIKITIP